MFKTIMIGEGGVGKTSILVRYTEDRFDEHMKMTIGVNFATKNITVNGHTITLVIWDLGGQPRFHDVVQDYFKGAKLAFAVYDVTLNFTLDRLDDWIQRVKSEAPDCVFLLVGNKAEAWSHCQGVKREDAIAFASKYQADWIEVSAKTGEGVVKMFQMAAEILAKKYCE